MKKQLRGSAYLLLATIFWGTTFVAQDAAMNYIKPFTFQAVRCGLAVIGLLALFIFYRCPHCKGRFPMKKPLNTTVCPHCGKDLGAKI